MFLTMSSNRDFQLRREWVNYLDQMATEDEEVAFLDIDSDEDWHIFKSRRPITAHLLEELFGRERSDARNYVKLLDEDFTEEKAVKIVSYVYNSPKKYKRPKKGARVNQFNNVRRKE